MPRVDDSSRYSVYVSRASPKPLTYPAKRKRASHLLATGAIVKQVIAIIKPHLAEPLIESLLRAPVEALTVREVRGYGRQKDYLNQYGETEYALAFLPKLEVEVWVDDSRLQEVVELIEQNASTGRLGDGKIMILPVKTFRPLA